MFSFVACVLGTYVEIISIQAKSTNILLVLIFKPKTSEKIGAVSVTIFEN